MHKKRHQQEPRQQKRIKDSAIILYLFLIFSHISYSWKQKNAYSIL